MSTSSQETPEPLLVGSLVKHAEHGEGQVTQLVRGGRAVLVRFARMGKLDLQVPASELLPTTKPKPKPKEKAVAQAVKPGPLKIDAAQILEALRLGTVPSSGLDLYTVGREAELSIIEADLDAVSSGKGAGRVILGDYGTGKTHLLECIAATARKRGFLVGHAALDPVDVPASNPRRVYRALMRELCHAADPSLERGVWPLLRRAQGNDEVKRRFLTDERHAYLTPVLSLVNRLDESELPPIIDWLEGSPQDYTPELNARFRLYGQRALPAIMDYRPWANIYSYILSGVSALAAATGSKGLVLLLDEAEFFRVLSSENREFAERLFRSLMAAALPANELPFSPEDEPRGGRGEFKTLSHRYVGHCPLYVVMAMTPTGQGDRLVQGLVPPSRVTELSPLNAVHHRELARRIVTVYAESDPSLSPLRDSLSTLIGDLMFKGLTDGTFQTPRTAVKFVLDLLDLARQRPDAVRLVMDELKRLWY